MDKAHAEHQYDQWMKNQKIADVLLRFGNCLSSEEEFEQRIEQYDKKTVKNHGE
ncbi:hypothetical protein KA405_01945 [Patescibacteria group bacterium]|nr:hypothetical protein [Patescibacteria group bacterium]